MLFRWMHGHKELVRQLPAPLRSVEIAFEHHDFRIKGIRQEKWLKLYMYGGNERLGKMEFAIDGKNQLVHKKGATQISRESFESILSCYCSLMAFMVYEKPEMIPAEESRQTRKAHHAGKRVGGGAKTTYILSHRTKAAHGPLGGHHASPKGIFTVRGHYRRYKSGKVVWIQEYKKGEGDKKFKTYKMGGKANEQNS
ncbi:MAG: hypothetical protein IJ741_07085 [Schwartzia sp.]|nr:hypothetical protein [Schwartzia sp. (in: firmicutes)]